MTERPWRCTGEKAGLAALPLANSPGRSALDWRLGTAQQFLDELVERLAAERVTIGTMDSRPFATLNWGKEHSWVTALLGSWAMVGDILSFYNERLLNEGFLGTAVEPGAIEALLKGGGLSRGAVVPPSQPGALPGLPMLDPGAAATAWFAFSMQDAAGLPTKAVVPARSQIRHHGAAEKVPPTFETDRAVSVRLEWNAMAPYRPVVTVPPALAATALGLKLDGALPPKPGQPLLVLGGGDHPTASRIVVPQAAVVNKGAGFVQLVLAPSDGQTDLDRLDVHSFAKALKLFGADAPAFADQPAKAKLAQGAFAGGVTMIGPDGKAVPCALNTPDAAMLGLGFAPTGQILLATAKGAFVWGEAGWAAAEGGLTNREITSLQPGADGTVLAGAGAGSVFMAVDPARGWDRLVGGFVVDSAKQPRRATLPAAVVRKVVAGGEAGSPLCLTDQGLFAFSAVRNAWLPVMVGDADTPLVSPEGSQRFQDILFIGKTLLAAAGCSVLAYEPLAPHDPVPPAWGKPNATAGHTYDLKVPVRAIAYVAAEPHFAAATDAGVLDHEGKALGTGLPAKPVTAFAGSPGGGHLAAAIDGQVWLYSGDAWTIIHQSAGGTVTALALADDGTLLVAEPPVFSSQWPGFALADSVVELAQPNANVPPGALVLVVDTASGREIGARVAKREAAFIQQFGLKASVTRLTLVDLYGGRPVDLSGFDRRSTQVWVGDRRLPVHAETRPDTHPIGPGDALLLAGFYGDLADPDPASQDPPELASGVGGAWRHPVPSPFLSGNPFYADNLAGNSVPPSEAERKPDRRLVAVTGKPARVLTAGAGGVHGLAGQVDSVWLAAREITGLAVAGDACAALAKDGGLFLWNGTDWAPDQAAPAGSPLVASLDGGIAALAGKLRRRGADGQWADWGGALPGAPATCLLDAGGGKAFLGTGRGLYLGQAQGEWAIQAGEGLTMAARITALLAVGGSLVVGTDGDGMLVGPLAGGTGWISHSAHLPPTITALAALPDGHVLAGTPQGLYVAQAGEWNWAEVDGASGLAITALAVAGTTAYAGTKGAGLLTGTGRGAWRPLSLGPSNWVLALAAGGPAPLLAATSTTTLLRDGKGGLGTVVNALQGAVDSGFDKWLNQGIVTPDFLQACKQAKITLPEDPVVAARLGAGGWLLQPGKGGAPLILRKSGPQILALLPAPPLVVTAAAEKKPRWSLWVIGADGASGPLDGVRDADFILLPADKEAAALTLVRQVEKVRPDPQGRFTKVLLDRPLGVLLDPQGVAVNANVAPASQGETVKDEVLGDGDGGRAGQSFTLRRPPLVFLPAPPPLQRRSTLQVKVDNVPWTEVDSLWGCGPRDRVYTVAIGLDGNAAITFGDGINGARLPSGQGNVTASYRSGMGPVSDLGTQGVDLLLSSPVGVARTPLAVPDQPAQAPSQIATERLALPRRAASMGRLITARDYETFVLAFQGVDKARVDQLCLNERPYLHLTIAADASGAAPPAALVDGLKQVLAAAQAAPPPDFGLSACRPVVYRIAATLWTRPGADADAVCRQAEQVLRDRFGNDGAELGKPLPAETVLAALQRVDGVAGVRLVDFHPLSQEPQTCRRIEARPARLGRDGIVLPAELPVLQPGSGGVSLNALPMGAEAAP